MHTPDIADDERALVNAAQVLRDVTSVVVFTGAGISKESGIPTFRDAQTGIWANDSPEDLATREGFLRNPQRVWSWYDFRRNKVWSVDPNPGHLALVELESYYRSYRRSFTLVTQNIDNLHQRAGSRKVLELHGNIFRYKCLDQNHPVRLEELPDDGKNQADEGLPPRCPRCQSFVRPDVVWFGEILPEAVLKQAFDAASTTGAMLVVGTSGVVHPAAGIPIMAGRHGAHLMEINPEESALTPMVDTFLRGPSGIILPRLVRAMTAENA